MSVNGDSSSPRFRASYAAYNTTETYSQQSKLTILKERIHPVSWKNIRQQSLLGKGSFSEVYRVYIDTPELEDKQCALKFLSPKITDIADGDFDLPAIDLAMEVDLLSRLNHDNIIKLHGIYDGDLKSSYIDSERGYFLLLDLLEDTLPKRLERCRAKERRKRFGCNIMVSNAKMIERIENVALGIAKGMECLHNNGVIFRDLKPANVGFTRNGNPVIFDFGFAREIHTLQKNEVAGSLRYMSPEMAFGQNPLLPSDVYSFGVLLFEICTLQKPFKQFTDRSDFTEHVLLCDYRPSLSSIPSKAIRDLISSCWDPDHTKRPDMTYVVNILRIEIALTGSQIQAATIKRSSSFSRKKSFQAEGVPSQNNINSGSINLNREEGNFVSDSSLAGMSTSCTQKISSTSTMRKRLSFGSRSSFNSRSSDSTYNSGDSSIKSEFSLGQLRKPFKRPSFLKS